MPDSLTFCGRTFHSHELELMRQIAAQFSALGVTEIARTVCELLEWKRPSGGLKNHECRQLLEQLAAEGTLALPELRRLGGRGPRRVDVSAPCCEPAPIDYAVSECEPLQLILVEGKAESRLWREQMERYHYLGHRVPFGAQLRYFVRDRERELACLLWTSPAWKMQPRDVWIGWSDEQRRGNLQSIVNNGRFLVLPWVRIKGLASKILALSARQLPATGRTDMDIVRCCWKRWWTRRVFAEPATGRQTGSMLGRPPDAAAWTESTKVTANPSKTSISTL